ncbi:hypothetical protein Tco_1310551 [Tanacetum coccineum]
MIGTASLNQIVEMMLVIVDEQLVLDMIVDEPLMFDEKPVQSMIVDCRHSHPFQIAGMVYSNRWNGTVKSLEWYTQIAGTHTQTISHVRSVREHWGKSGPQNSTEPDIHETPTTRTEPRRRHGNRHSRSPSPIVSVFRRLKRNRPLSPRPRPRKEGVCSIGWEEKNIVHLHALTATTKVTMSRNLRYNQGSVIITAHRPEEPADIRRVKTAREGHWKSKSKRHRSDTYEDDLSQSWTCEERNPFTPWIRHFDFPRTRMPSHVKTYDGSGDPEDHLKRF